MPQRSEELAYRLRQQEVLAGFGLFALQATDLDALLQEACRIGASGLGGELSKVLEYLQEEDQFFLRAGIGWRPGVIGHAHAAADLGSAAGYCFRTGEPVLSSHLGAAAAEGEDRFRTSPIMAEHGVR